MVKHIVLWKLHSRVEGRSKEANARMAREQLEGLYGKIPGLLKIEVGFDFSRTDASADLILYSEFESRAALEVYAAHPAHAAVKGFMSAISSERQIADYEC